MSRARELRFVRRISTRPMPEENRRIAESLLADFVARLYIAEHPELFRRRTPVATPGAADASGGEPVRDGTQSSGSPQAAEPGRPSRRAKGAAFPQPGAGTEG